MYIPRAVALHAPHASCPLRHSPPACGFDSTVQTKLTFQFRAPPLISFHPRLSQIMHSKLLAVALVGIASAQRGAYATSQAQPVDVYELKDSIMATSRKAALIDVRVA